MVCLTRGVSCGFANPNGSHPPWWDKVTLVTGYCDNVHCTMTDLESSLEEALRQAQAALQDAERQHAEMEVRVQALRIEVAGLEAALQRRTEQRPAPSSSASKSPVLGPTFLTTPVLPNSPAAAGVATLVILLLEVRGSWVNKKRAAAVESVLQVAGGPVHRSDIAEALKRLGRSDTLESVSAALAYLNRSGRAHPVGDGYWAAGIVQQISFAKGGELRNEQEK